MSFAVAFIVGIITGAVVIGLCAIGAVFAFAMHLWRSW